MAAITSMELNYLVFRYLQESGFIHAAFTLGYEAGINKCIIDGSMVPPGALITFVQKGLQYLEMEANLACQSDADEDFSLLQPLDLITKDVHELQQLIKEKKGSLHRDRDKLKDKNEHVKDSERDCLRLREKDRHVREKECQRNRERKEKEKMLEKELDDDTREMVNHQEEKEPTTIAITSTSRICEISSSEVMVLEGHSSEVCACAWSPTGAFLASGSGDSTARIWKITPSASRSITQKSSLDVLVLKHVKGRTNEKNKDVTSLDWNFDGTLLATGSFDGQARIWNANGYLKTVLNRHQGPIFSIKWNKKGDYLISGSSDESVIVWDVNTEDWKQQVLLNSGHVLDIDWRDDFSFAASSSRNLVFVCEVGAFVPTKTFVGHEGEVNCVKWSPTGSLLASCSDDMSVKLWSIYQDNCVCDMRGHSKEIYTLKWSPCGTDTNNPSQQLILASASFDSTVKLWDIDHGKLLGSLNGHRGPVYAISFSPNGEFLASGSRDGCVIIWSLKEKKMVKTFSGKGGIFEVCWNKQGDQIAACFANSNVCVLNFRM